MSKMWPTCYCPAGRPSGHPRHAGCWIPDRSVLTRIRVAPTPERKAEQLLTGQEP